MNHKTYTINGKRLIHRPLSPMQLIRIAALFAELQEFIRAIGASANASFMVSGVEPGLRNDPEVDMTYIYAVLTKLESEKPELIVRLMNAVFVDADTNRPCYLTDRLTIEDFESIDPPTFLEVVADFFTLNDASRTSSMILSLMRTVTNSTASPIPSAVKAPADPKATENG